MAKASPLQTEGDAQESASLDRIYNDPATAHALDLFERFGGKALTGEGLEAFLNTLPADAAAERTKLEGLLSGANTDIEADLSTRSGQLVWAAGLGHAFQTNPSATIRTHPIWRVLTKNPHVSGSLGATARFIDLSAANRNATMDWGTPGSWFWFSPDKNHVNIDLFHTLLTGFGEDPAPNIKGMAHASGVMMHEVGHSQLTTRFTDKMMELRGREEELLDASKERKLTQDEFKELARVRTEFGLRMNVMNAAEDNCVNQYAANHGQEFPHDFGASLNVCNILLQGSGHYLRSHQDQSREQDSFQELLKKLLTGPKQQQVEKAAKAFSDLNKAIALSFYATNGLFDRDDVETWKRLGVNPDDIKATDTGGAKSAADHFLSSSKSDFERLLDLNVGSNGMSSLQPQSRDRWLLRSVFARSIETYADRRCRVIDQIWDAYAAQHAQILIDAAEEEAQNRMDQKQQENGQQQDGNQGQGDGQLDQQNEGQSGQGQGSSQGNSGDDPSPSQGGSGSGEDSEASQSENENSVDVEGVGKMDLDDKPLPSTPEEARKGNRGNDEEDVNPESAQTVRDLAKESKKQEAKETPSNNNKGSGGQESGKDEAPSEPSDSSAADMESGGGQGGSSGYRKVDLSQLAQGDWRDYRKRINELEPVIAQVSDDFSYIRERQKQTTVAMSRKTEELPRGGNIYPRLDMRRQLNLAVKMRTGQKIERRDLRRWKTDEVTTEPTSVELYIIGDGSGSNRRELSHGVRRIDSCIQTMGVLYEAGKRADFDVYAGVWENHDIRMMAKPGDPEKQVGENFEAVRTCGGVGDLYITPFPGIIEGLSKQHTSVDGKQKRFAGMTHFLWIFDGTPNSLDVRKTSEMFLKLFQFGPGVTVDIAYLGGHDGCELKEIVSRVKQANPSAPIDIIEAFDANEAPMMLSRQVKRRLEGSMQDLEATLDVEKRDAFARVHSAIMQANLG